MQVLSNTRPKHCFLCVNSDSVVNTVGSKEKVVGLILTQSFFHVVFLCPCICVGSLHVLQLPPTVQTKWHTSCWTIIGSSGQSVGVNVDNVEGESPPSSWGSWDRLQHAHDPKTSHWIEGQMFSLSPHCFPSCLCTQQTSVGAATRWVLTIHCGSPTPTGWTPTIRRSPTSWRVQPILRWPDATWACQEKVGKTWWSGASAKSKPEGKWLCSDASFG